MSSNTERPTRPPRTVNRARIGYWLNVEVRLREVNEYADWQADEIKRLTTPPQDKQPLTECLTCHGSGVISELENMQKCPTCHGEGWLRNEEDP